MKKVLLLLLLLTLPTLALATSQRCANNYNDARSYYKSASDYAESSKENYDAYSNLANETVKAFTMDGIYKRRGGKDYTADIMTAMDYLNAAISDAKQVIKNVEKGHRYSRAAFDYCDGEDYEHTRENYEIAEKYLSRAQGNLGAEIEQVDLFNLVTDYTAEPFNFLSRVLRRNMTDAAIALIENEQIDLNFIPEENRPLLIIAAQNGSTAVVNALIARGADLDIQYKGYTALETAGVEGNFELFRSLFDKKASPFLLEGFHSHPEYASCNIADLVDLSSYNLTFDKDLFVVTRSDEHQQISKFLKGKGLVPICELNRTAATVDGREIKEFEVDVYLDNFVTQQRANDSEFQLTDEQLSDRKQGILEYLIGLELLAHESSEAKLSTKEDQIKNQLSQFKERFPLIAPEALKQLIIREQLAELTRQKIAQNITITNEELHTYYTNNLEQFQKPSRIHLRAIILSDEAKAKEVLALAKDGHSFAELAQQYSEDNSAAQGGDLGFISRGQLPKEMEDAAFALRSGNISEVIESVSTYTHAYIILKLIEREDDETVPFDAVKGQLRDWMKKQKSDEEVSNWTNKRASESTIEINRT